MASAALHLQSTTDNEPRLADFRINGVAPFWSAPDNAEQCMSEAHALLTVMSAAMEDSEYIVGQQIDAGQRDSNFGSLRASIQARAVDGVARLIALAQYSADVDYRQRMARGG